MTTDAKYVSWVPDTHGECDISQFTPHPQRQRIFWIGCSDARVSEARALGLDTEAFVHRNIANQFPMTDPNALAVLTHAVSLHTIEEIMVVGHTGAPAVHWALRLWLTHLIHLAKRLAGGTERDLAEANVRIQVKAVRAVLPTLTSRKLKVTGHIFDIELNELQPVADD